GPGRLDVKIKIDRPDKAAAKDIFSKYLTPDLPWHPEELAQDEGDAIRAVERLIWLTVESMYALSEENQYLEVTYGNGDKETFYLKDFSSGALIEGIVSRAKKYAIKRLIANRERGMKSEDLLKAVRDEFKADEDVANTTNPCDWVKTAGKSADDLV